MLKRLQLMVSLMLLVFLVSVFFSLTYSHISLDAPYYLSVARDISLGYIPYKDIYLSYTPLVMYMNSLVYLIIEDFSYKIFLGFQYSIMLLSQIIFFQLLLRHFKISFSNSALLSMVLGIAILSADGSYINLEVYMFLAVISALYFFYKDYIIVSGIFIGISFLLKQYGLLNFLPFFLLIYLTKKRPGLNMILFMLGSASTIIVFLFYFVIIQGVPVISILEQLSGIKYIKYVSNRSPSIYTWILGAKVFLILFIPMAVLLGKKLLLKKNIPWVVGIVMNLIPTFLQAFQHYVILTFPYLFILFALNWKSANTLFFKSILISGFAMAILLNLRVFRYQEIYANQIEVAKTAEKYVPRETEIFLNGDIRFLYCLNNYKNPLREEIGYSYFHFLETEDFEKIKVLSPFPLPNIPTNEILLVDKFFYLKL